MRVGGAAGQPCSIQPRRAARGSLFATGVLSREVGLVCFVGGKGVTVIRSRRRVRRPTRRLRPCFWSVPSSDPSFTPDSRVLSGVWRGTEGGAKKKRGRAYPGGAEHGA